MPPNQEQKHASGPLPLHPPSQPVVSPQPGTQPNGSLSSGGMKIIQPTGNVTAEGIPSPQINPRDAPTVATPTVITPPEGQPVIADSNSSNLPINPPRSPIQPSSIYPTPQSSTAPVTKDSVQRDLSNRRRRKALTVMTAIIVILILAGAGGFYYLYSKQDHSVYSKLANATYTQNGYNLSFGYPSIMTHYNSNNPAILLAYEYKVKKGEGSGVGLGGPIPYGKALSHLGITPSEVISSLVTHTGNFADVIKKDNPSAFTNNGLYGSCHSYITTNSGQIDALCVASQSGVTVARVIGEDDTNQYTLFITATNQLWSEHQQVWQKVEKSFSY